MVVRRASPYAGTSIAAARRSTHRFRAAREGQLAIFDLVLMVPLLVLVVVLVNVLSAPTSTASTSGTQEEFLARTTLHAWLQTTVLSGNYSTPSGQQVLLTDTTGAVLLQELVLWIGCGQASAQGLDLPGGAGAALYQNLEALSHTDFQWLEFSAQGRSCGQPVTVADGPPPPHLSQDLYTAWVTLPGLGAPSNSVTVGVALWGA